MKPESGTPGAKVKVWLSFRMPNELKQIKDSYAKALARKKSLPSQIGRLLEILGDSP